MIPLKALAVESGIDQGSDIRTDLAECCPVEDGILRGPSPKDTFRRSDGSWHAGGLRADGLAVLTGCDGIDDGADALPALIPFRHQPARFSMGMQWQK